MNRIIIIQIYLINVGDQLMKLNGTGPFFKFDFGLSDGKLLTLVGIQLIKLSNYYGKRSGNALN